MSSHLPSERFAQNAAQALRDERLRGALRRATGLFAERRAAAIAERPDWEALRTRARAIKDEVLGDLEAQLARFCARAEAAGARVHHAADAVAANDIIAAIADSAGARRVVKSKSMTTEEIRLNEALAARGCEVLETDLGEWIIQLADEVPSHIIVPAIHKTRDEIAKLLVDKTGIPWTDEPDRLTAAARDFLRQRFAEADLGISGVNFAIVETGSILVLENEGNARFTTSLPRVHVAVMGIEKLLPRLADLPTFLRLLPRSGTGQHLTSYQSLLTGPARQGEEGPGELHIVVLDNGRRRMLDHPLTRSALACIRCGACLNACPVYQQIGGHAYGSVYPGPIGAVITPQLAGMAKTAQLPFASSLCGACREVCPVKIDIPALLLHLRGEVTGSESADASIPRGKRRRERLGFRLWAWCMAGRRRYAVATGMARLMQRVCGRPPRVGPLRAWTAGRELRPLAGQSFRRWWRREGGP